nr:reverse transcriptase domain-containing protein [Tanacetum cinerariifolium]
RVSKHTGSSRHDESPYAVLGQSDSEEESEKVVLGADERGQGKGQAGPDPGTQAEGQTGSDAGAQDEGQAGSNPEEISKGQARPDPGNTRADKHSISSPVVHAGSERKQVDLDVADVSPQPSTEQLDEGFTATAYPKVHQQFKATTTETTTTTTTTLPPLPAQQQSNVEAMMMKCIDELEHIMANLIQVSKAISEVVTDAVDWAMQAPLRNRFKDLPEADIKEILHQRMWEIESYKSHEDHMQLFEALEKSMNRDHSEELAQDLAEARKKKKKSRVSPKTPHGSPPHQPPPPPLPAWTTTDIRLMPSISLIPADLEIDEDTGPDEQAQLSDDEDIGSAHIPKVNLRQDWWKPFEEERPATLEPAWSIQSSNVPVPTNKWASAMAYNYSPPPKDSLFTLTGDIATFIDWFCKRRECHKLLTDNVDDPILRNNVSKPLPLGGLPSQVTIQSDFFFNKDLEYIRYGSKGSRPALSISKMKATYYPDARLEQMALDQFWIDEECKYDIATIAVRTHMRILSVVRIKVFSMYGDFEDLYLLNLQGHLNHLPPKDKKILTTAINQWTKHLDKYGVQMIMRFNEIHKFSDGILQQIDEALDYRVKEFKINRMNPGLNTSEDGNPARANFKQALANELTNAFRKPFEVLNNVFEHPRWENDPRKLGTAPDLIERLVRDQILNPTSSTNPNPKGRNRRRSKQRIENLNLEEHSHPVVTMADQRTMAELLRTPTDGYAEAIVVSPILAEQFELKHSLINMMTTDQFFRLEKDNSHDHICWFNKITSTIKYKDVPSSAIKLMPFPFSLAGEASRWLEKEPSHSIHICWFNKITSTIKYKDVPSSAIKLMLFPFSLAGAASRWLEKEPSHSIHTWEDLVSKFLNEFFPPSRTTNLRNEISNFQQRFDESFHEAWDRYKDLLCACPHHGITELHQLVTFYNALNPADQDSLNAAASGNLLERTPVKAVEETCVTCGGAHPYYQCLTTGGNTFPELRDNIQGYVSAAAVNYYKGNPGYRPPSIANQIRPPGFAQPNVQNNQNRFGPPQGFNHGNNLNHEQSYQAPTQQNQNVHLNELEKVKRINKANMKAMQTQIDMVKNELRNKMKSSIQTSLSNQTNEIKNMMASILQMNTAFTSGSGSLLSNTVANPKGKLKAITTRSGLVIDGHTIPTPPQSINSEVDEHVEETFTDPNLAEYTIKVPPPPKMLKALLSNKEKLQELANTPLNENCSAVILKKLPEKLRDPGKFLILCGFSELKCKALAYLGASINLMSLSVWKKLGLPELIPTRMTLELANRVICTPAGIARDVFVPVGKFTFPIDFVIVDYESDPRVSLILGRTFLQTSSALIDVHGEEMILRDGDERLTLNMRHDTSSYSNQPQKESINLINVFKNSSEDFLEAPFPHQPSGNLIFLPHLELISPEVTNDIFDSEGCNDFADELPPEYDDNLRFNIEFDLKEIEFLLYQDKYSSLKVLIDQKDLANLADIFVDPIPEMFTDEHALDYLSASIFNEYDDDFLEVESDAGNVYDDPFDSKGEKIKESKLLINELDLPCDFHPPSEHDSFISQDFSRVDALPSTNNEDKIFNPVWRELGQAQRPKISASWEAPHAYPIPGNVKTLAKGFCTQVFISSASTGNHVKDNKENVKIRTKPDKIKSKREAWKSPDASLTKLKPSQSQESIKLLELMLSKRSRKNTKCVNAADEELTAAKHKLMLLVYCC